MADDAAFYRNRAEQERANADAAELENVRERCDRAARSWEAMAARAELTQVRRASREAATAEARMAAAITD